MHRMITKRWLLVLLVAAGQVVCLIIGIVWFSQQLRAGMASLLREQVLDNNRLIAAQLGERIVDQGITDLSVGTPGWEWLQKLVEQVQLPNQGFVCVIDDRDGGWVCHPELRGECPSEDAAPGQRVLHTEKGETRIAEASSREGTAAGWVRMPDGVHYIAVQDLPELGVKLLAHQREAGIAGVIDRVAGLVRTTGITVILVLVLSGVLVTTLIVQGYENRLADINENLERLVEQRSRSLLRTRDAVIFGLAKLAESRDDETGEHLERIREYVGVLARELARTHPELDEEAISLLEVTSSLHDVGKVGMPDAILLKPGELTEEERGVIRMHPVIGGDCLMAIKQRLGEDDFLETACQVALAHHERWDGSGYPFGLKGEQIPLAARIVALADVYDALTTKRKYKPAFTHQQAREAIVEGAGKHLDPGVVEAFLAREAEFRSISAKPASERAAAQAPGVGLFRRAPWVPHPPKEAGSGGRA